MKPRALSRLVLLLLVSSLLPAAEYTLKVTPQTIAWGYYWAAAQPVLSVRSGCPEPARGAHYIPGDSTRSARPRRPPVNRTGCHRRRRTWRRVGSADS